MRHDVESGDGSEVSGRHAPPVSTVRLVRNSALIVLARLVGVLVMVAAVPFVVGAIGTEGYGVWESFLAVSGFALVFQAAVSGTVVWRVAMSYGASDPVETRRVVRLGIGGTTGLLVICLPAVWIFRGELLGLLRVPGPWGQGAGWLLPSIVGVALLTGVNESLRAVLIGYQRAGVAALIEAAGLVLTHGGAVAFLMAGHGLEALLYGYAAGFGGQFVLLYPLASSLCGRFSPMPLAPTRQDLKVLGPFAGLVLVSGLTGLLRDQTDKLVLASLDSPSATAFFGMAQRLASVVMQTFLVVRIPFGAAIGALYARHDWAGIRDLYASVGAWIAFLAGLAGFLVSTLRSPLLVAWLGRDYPEVHVFLALQLIGVVSAVIFSGAATALVKGVGRPGLETAYTLLTLALTVISKPLFIHWFGGVGSVASSAASWAPGALFLMVLAHRRLDLGGRMIWRHLGVYAATVGLAALGWLGTSSLSPTGRLQATLLLVGLGPLLALVYLGVLGLLGLAPPFRWRRPTSAGQR